MDYNSRSTLKLFRVPWDSNYENTINWTADKLSATFSGNNALFSFSNLSYIRDGGPVVIDLPYNQSSRCNYCVVENPAFPGDVEKSRFYFVTPKPDYSSPGATIIYLQKDVWTTHHLSTKYGNAFIDKGHVAIANSNVDAGDIRSMRKYLTVAEDLNTGGQLTEVKHYFVDVKNIGQSLGSHWKYAVWVSSDLSTDPGTIDDPNQKIGESQDIDGVRSPLSVLIFDQAQFATFADAVREYSWIAQNIKAVKIVPDSIIGPDDPDGIIAPKYILHEKYGISESIRGPSRQAADLPVMSISPVSSIISSLPTEYQHLKKFATYPYSCIEIAYTGCNSIIAKPELLADSTMQVNARGSILGPDSQLKVFIAGYNSETTRELIVSELPTQETVSRFWQGEELENALVISGWPSIPVVGDGSNLALANSAYTRAFSYESAGWSQTKSLAGIRNSLSIGNAQLGANSLSNKIANKQIDDSQLFNALGGAANAVTSFSPLGMAGGALGTALQFQSAQISQNAMNANFAVQQDLQRMTLDKNSTLSDYVARGDYDNTINGILSQVSQAQLTPPSMVGALGGELFNVSNGLSLIVCRLKTVVGSDFYSIADYWMLYGYSIHRYIKMPASLQCMTNFTYWKCINVAIISTDADEDSKNVLRGIFARGTTVWESPDDIGNIALTDNRPILRGYY